MKSIYKAGDKVIYDGKPDVIEKIITPRDKENYEMGYRYQLVEAGTVSHIEREFTVVVCRTSYAFRTLTIKAKNEEEAKEKALDEAGDYEFSESNADYEIDSVQENKTKK